MGMNVGVSGRVKAIIYNHNTNQTREHEFDNKVTDQLLSALALLLTGQVGRIPAKFIMGTGTGTVAQGDTSLFTPVTQSIIGLATQSVSGNVVTYTINYPRDYVTGTFTEAGLMDSTNALQSHFLLSPNIQIVAGESVTFLYTITLASQ